MLRNSLTLSAFGLVAISSATITQVGSRAALSPNDLIDWGQYNGLVNSPSLGLTNNSQPFQVRDNNDTPMIQIVTSGTAGVAPFWGLGGGHNALFTTENTGPMDITFGASQMGAGADIMVNAFGTWTARLTAYDNLNNLLGSVTTTVVSDLNIVGNAPFLGLVSTDSDIARISFSLDSTEFPGGFAIDEVSLASCAVPEPASMAIMGLGVLGLVIRRRNKR